MSGDDRRLKGQDEIDSLLCAAPINAQPLSAAELAVYRDRDVSCGWRFEVGFPDQVRRLDVLVGPNFPRESILVALVDRPPFLTWPHVEKDGVLCVQPSTTDVDHSAPAEVAATVLNDACELVEQLIRGERTEDFKNEFLSYWGWGVDSWRRDIWSLLLPDGPSRHFCYWRGQGFYLLGETTEQLTRWLKHYDRAFEVHKAKFSRGTLLWLPELPTPEDFPKQASDLVALARKLSCTDLLEPHLHEDIPPLIVLGGNSNAGPCFAATIVADPEVSRAPNSDQSSRLIKGFRSNRVPHDLLRARRFGSAPLKRAIVERADASWVHGRDHDPRFKTMRDSSVTIVGCGSLGGHLAMRLAEAGVGRLNLVDPQALQWPNLGRHPLSSQHVGHNKAEQLAKVLSQRYPQANDFRSSTLTCQKLLSENSSFFSECNLIISAMGSWAAEGALNAWHIHDGRKIPILYTWTEPHAVAGHAVAICAVGSCLQCGFHANGRPKFLVADWPKETTAQEPGCGAVFQPYGPIEFSHITALAAELVLDLLLGEISASTHRIWCARRSLLDAAGGQWSKEWSKIAATHPLGGFIEERPWPGDSECSECARTA
mgnify:CR=1 FL=1